MQPRKKLAAIVGGNTLIQILLIVIFQRLLPAQIPTHFGFTGQTDSYSFTGNPLLASLVLILIFNLGVFLLNYANFLIPHLFQVFSLFLAASLWVILLRLLLHVTWLVALQFGLNIVVTVALSYLVLRYVVTYLRFK
ncbi:DUF1648 domain-containing protein [Loigolactobacillus binensis]|uniref:DUF1648 domain-containing protein n=1 Tax=Loigolactobacillus binensis TaxID=2559922 RepID=A0ABW3EAG4_9LACO|nr:DUF1648 domain-containing protein [Loigolactobacillus binensis]